MCRYNKKITGLTFLEIVISLSIFAVALVGLLQILNTALNSSYRAIQESIATNLSRGLMAEIMSKNFVDPQNPTGTGLGPNAVEGESGRNTFDDVDDYNGYSESPPVTIGGLPMNGTQGTPDYSRFTRSVTVSYCNISGSDIVDVTPGPTDYKHITVTVSGPFTRNIVIHEVKKKE